jgi:TRAP-type C4-dicarboxylate transport system substrate-binding protein
VLGDNSSAGGGHFRDKIVPMNRRNFAGMVASAAALLVLGSFMLVQGYSFGQSDVTVRWLIAHEPADVFVEAEKAFAYDLAARTNGKFAVTVLTPSDVGYEGQVPESAIFDMLRNGEIDLVTMNVDSLIAASDTDLEVLHLPYLFKDYASADKVLNGATGEKLLSLVDEIAPAHALAFTYSGGFRIIATTKPVAVPQDLAGMSINTWGDRILQDNLRSLGATPIAVPVNGGRQLIEDGLSDGAEVTYSRAEGPLGPAVTHILETNHVLFLSALLAGKSFYSSLSENEKEVLKSAAVAAASIERGDSIEYGNKIKNQLLERGVVVTTLEGDARSAFESWGEKIRSSFNRTGRGAALITEILNAQKQ